LNRPAIAGYRALLLLLKHGVSGVNKLNSAVWKKWAPVALTYPINSGEEELHWEIIRLFYQNVPKECIKWLNKIIDMENMKGYIFITRKFERCWDDRLSQAILFKLNDNPKLKATCLETLLDELFQHSYAPVKQYCYSFIEHEKTTDDYFEKKVSIISSLLANADISDWEILWPLVRSNNEIGHAIAYKVASQADYKRIAFIEIIPITELGEFYIWLAKEFPHKTDPQFDTAHTVGPREQVAHFRDRILERIKNRGTAEAIETIQKIKTTLNLPWLDFTLQQVREINAEKSWKPLSPKQIIRLGPKYNELESNEDIGLTTRIAVNPCQIIRIIHLSDLHINSGDDITSLRNPLIADLNRFKEQHGYNKPDFLVISGDLTNQATPEEFIKAKEFVETVLRDCGLASSSCIIAPGNHDLHWLKNMYEFQEGRLVNRAHLKEGEYVSLDNNHHYLIRNQSTYPQKFSSFADFYLSIMSKPYPMAFEEQCPVSEVYLNEIQFLNLNSCWEIDQYFPNRSSINLGALARGLADSPNTGILKIAVCHHPISGNEKIPNTDFLEQLKNAGIRIVLHGHVHTKGIESISYYDLVRRMYAIGAGSFGAPVHARPESVPRMYNIIEIYGRERIRVYTRAKDTVGGDWRAHAIWPISGQLSGQQEYYEIDMRS
jgi:UDP-2,3-diacylglucosamine pyrophosphatase LpxH